MKKVVLATEKPFSAYAVEQIRAVITEAGYTFSLLEKYSADELKAEIKDASALIVRSDKVTKELVAIAEKLEIVVRAGAGYDNLDLESLSARRIVAMNTPGQNSNAVAELALGMMIYMARNNFKPGTGTELKAKKLGIHAYGNVGRLVAKLAKGFGMEVCAFDPFVDAESLKKEGVKPVETMKELYSSCDYVSVHIPATPQTIGSINYDILSSLPKNATIINTARKEVVDEAALLRILSERSDVKYASDIAPSNLADLQAVAENRVFATPKKMGAETAEANVNAGIAAANQIVNYFKNNDTRFQVNKFC